MSPETKFSAKKITPTVIKRLRGTKMAKYVAMFANGKVKGLEGSEKIEAPVEPPVIEPEPEAIVKETPVVADVPVDDSGDTDPEVTVEEEPVIVDAPADAVPENDPVDYSKMSKAQLLVAMPELGFTVEDMAGKTKADLLEMIKA